MSRCISQRTIKLKSIGKDGVVFTSIFTESKLQLSLAHKYKLCCNISLFFLFLYFIVIFLKTIIVRKIVRNIQVIK